AAASTGADATSVGIGALSAGVSLLAVASAALLAASSGEAAPGSLEVLHPAANSISHATARLVTRTSVPPPASNAQGQTELLPRTPARIPDQQAVSIPRPVSGVFSPGRSQARLAGRGGEGA